MPTATSPTIDLMRKHISVRKYTDEQIPENVLQEIIEAGRAASTWRNLQSYSIIVVEDQAKKDKLAEWTGMPYVAKCPAFLVFVGDLHRAAQCLPEGDHVQAKGVEPLLVSSVDAALAAQNIILAAESLGYGGVFIGYIRNKSAEVAELLGLPEYTYPITGLCLGRPASSLKPAKARLPYNQVVFKDSYGPIDTAELHNYDKTQADYLASLGAPAGMPWTGVAANQWATPSQTSTEQNLKANHLI